MYAKLCIDFFMGVAVYYDWHINSVHQSSIASHDKKAIVGSMPHCFGYVCSLTMRAHVGIYMWSKMIQ